MDDLQACLAMVTKKAKDVLALHKNDLRGIERFGSDLVRLAGKGGTQTQDFAGAGDAEHQALAVLRANRQLGATIAKNENAASLPSLGKESSAPRKQTDALDGVEGLQCVRGEIAEDPVGPKLATKATRIGGALHTSWILTRTAAWSSDHSHF